MTLVGHEPAWRAWHEALAANRMHHAWLFAGRRGLGKATFAMDAALELVNRGSSERFPAERHPDIHILRPLPDGEEEAKKAAEGLPHRTKRNISIDQVRALERRLVTRPTVGSARAIVIDSVDDLEKNAVNALLKSLEEPPAGTVFLLVSHRPGRLLPTVRSRCRIVRFAELEDHALDALIRREMSETGPDARAAALLVASGSPGAAFRFLGSKAPQILPILRRIVGEGDPQFTLRSALTEAAGARPDRETQLAMIELAAAVAAEAARGGVPGQAERAIEVHVALTALLARAPTANFDAGLLLLETGGLLAGIAHPREAATGNTD